MSGLGNILAQVLAAVTRVGRGLQAQWSRRVQTQTSLSLIQALIPVIGRFSGCAIER